MSVSGSYYYGDIGAPGLIHQSTPRARLNYDNKSFRVSYDQTGVFENFNMKVQFYALLFQLKYKNPDGIVPVNSKHNNDAYAIEIQQSGKLAEGLDVAYGYTFRRDDLNSTDIKTKYRNNNAAYIMGTYSLPNLDFFFKELSLTPAVRYDYPSDFSAEVSPKLSLALKHSGAIRIDLKTHITRSYRAPTFNDLYWPKDSYAEGNPNLKPEMGFNYDIGIGFGTTQNNIGEVSLNVNYFVNKLDNLILWSPGSDGLWRPNNISKTLAQGMETVFRLKPFGEILEIGTDYTFIVALDKSENATTRDKDLIYRPRNKIDITATIRYAGIEIAGVNHYVGKRYINAANTVWLESYNVVDASLSYSFKVFEVNWSAKLEGTNLTDLDYTITEGSPVPGRAYRFTLGFSF
jgi:outer membrane cobalamin receptor